jgi:putative membrane protein
VGYGNGMGMGWVWLFWLLLLVGIALVVVVAVRAIGGGGTRGQDSGRREPSRARQILDERYARGDLTTEEYQERLRALGENT